MSELEALTLQSIAASAQSVATLLRLEDVAAARAALERAEHRLLIFSADKPAHARVVRLAREAVEQARAALDGGGGKTTRRLAGAQQRAVERAVERARL